MDQCAFCDRPRNEVRNLVEASKKKGVFICDRCITGSAQALGQEKKATGKEEKPLLKPKQIKEHLDGYVISQDRAKEDVAVAVYFHYLRREAMRRGLTLDGVEIQKSNILLMGPTGVGKTQLARAIARMLGVPFYIGDATKLTSAGYVGDDVESLLQGLLAACDGNIERAQWGIIFLDEADKLARKTGRNATGYRDVSGEGVQQSLLKLVEGSKMQVPRGMAKMGTTDHYDMIDTENILFILGGSFAGIDEIVKTRVNKGSRMGFGGADIMRKDMSETEVYQSITEEDILEFGIIPELLGRIPVHTSLLPLTEEEMVRVLTEPKDAIIRQFQALYSMDDIDLQFDKEALLAIGRQAKKRPTGARALRSIVEGVLKPYSYSCPSDPEVKTVRILEATVEQGAEAILVREPAQKLATA